MERSAWVIWRSQRVEREEKVGKTYSCVVSDAFGDDGIDEEGVLFFGHYCLLASGLSNEVLEKTGDVLEHRRMVVNAIVALITVQWFNSVNCRRRR